MTFHIISTAQAAATAAPAPHAGGISDLVILGSLILLFYFMLWRPQSKRARVHRELISGLSKGDEVVTNGGLVGKLARVSDDFIGLVVADGIEIKLQKQSVVSVLPKGTLKSI